MCIWYFSSDKEDLNSPVGAGFRTAIRYHLGSLAFGSFILAIVEFFYWLFEFIQKKVYKDASESNFAVKCMCGCVSCLVWCFKKCIEFLGKHAYIQIAMTGDSFCTASKASFKLILENAARFSVSGGLGVVFSFLGKISVTVLSSYIGYLIITKWGYISDELSNPVPPTVVFIIVSYVVASIFISVYDMACDSIIHAYLIDEERETGNHNYAPEALKSFFESNRKD